MDNSQQQLRAALSDRLAAWLYGLLRLWKRSSSWAATC